MFHHRSRVAQLADAARLERAAGKSMWVQVPPRNPVFMRSTVRGLLDFVLRLCGLHLRVRAAA